MNGKIYRLKTRNDNVLEFVKDLENKVREDGIENLMVACKGKKNDEYVITGYCNLGSIEKQELVSHIQIDIVDEMINKKYTTP